MLNWFDVIITIDGDTFKDAIKGTSPQDALNNAWDNWDDAHQIELIY